MLKDQRNDGLNLMMMMLSLRLHILMNSHIDFDVFRMVPRSGNEVLLSYWALSLCLLMD
jgi:hypothetical protein